MPSLPPQAALEDPTRLTGNVLQTLYANVTSLAALFDQDRLYQEDDSELFRLWLDETVVASDSITELSMRVTIYEEMPLDEVLEHAQDRIFAIHEKRISKMVLGPNDWRSRNPTNILALGYQSVENGCLDFKMNGRGRALSNRYPNTILGALAASIEWQALLDRVGAKCLITLFSDPSTAVFTALPNACYLQISGAPVADLKAKSTLSEILDQQSSEDAANVAVSSRKRRRQQKKRAAGHEAPKRNAKRRRTSKSGCSRDSMASDVRTAEVGTKGDVSMDSGENAMRKDAELMACEAAHISPLKALPEKIFALARNRRALGPSISLPQIVLRSDVPPAHRFARAASLSAPVSPLKRVASVDLLGGSKKARKIRKIETEKTPAQVMILRMKMYHARPCRTVDGKIAYGLSPSHVISRLPSLFAAPTPVPDHLKRLLPPARPDGLLSPLEQRCRHLLKHIFPRQFGLANVFTAVSLAWNFGSGYDNRDEEIKKFGRCKTPKRIKHVLGLAELMIKLHSKCNHRQLLDCFCPSRMKHSELSEADKSFILDLLNEPRTQISNADISIEVSQRSLIVPHGREEAAAKVKAKPKFDDYMCTPYEVESFVKSVIQRTIPRSFWGSTGNEALVLAHVSEFVRFRRYETTSLHRILQMFCITDCDWLRPHSAWSTACKNEQPNAVEMEKRKEILQEFMFWFFDSFVTDLIKTSFCVTESAVFRNRTLYFRQDDWSALCKPLLENLGDTMFEELSPTRVAAMMPSRKLGVSPVRLLPKDTGVRPIVNLRRRPMKVNQRGGTELGFSINFMLENTFRVLNFEKNRKLESTGAAVNGANEIYESIKRLKDSLTKKSSKPLPKLYFVKVDVRACFDTIKQEKLLEIVEAILLESEYRIHKYTSMAPSSGRVANKYPKLAFPAVDDWSFPELAISLAQDLRHTIFSDNVVYKHEKREMMLRLLREHVRANIVKIGNRFYRQKEGIPQGSVLSSLFCNLFYGDMEKKRLAFTKDDGSILLRYVDDFLFITERKPLAVEFLRVMDEGNPDYGCFITASKTLTNFNAMAGGQPILASGSTSKDFAWGGLMIHTETLDVKADRDRYDGVVMSDTLTVEHCKKPGQAFIYKMLQAMKARSHIIYNDTSHNSFHSVYLNVYQSFLVVALKFKAYVRDWKVNPVVRSGFFLRVIDRVLIFAYTAIRNRAQTKLAIRMGGECKIEKSWIIWLGHHAFHRILSRHSNLYSTILVSLRRSMAGSHPASGTKSSARYSKRLRCTMQRQLRKVVGFEGNRFADGR